MSPEKESAARMLAASHFHRRLWIPATDKHDRMRVTYATTSNIDDGTLPAILMISPMFATRWMASSYNELAKENGVRMISIDRPGFGGSTQVSLIERVAVWLETVPLVLQALNVKHVSLISHSAGTIYLYNTLHRYRDILDPDRPYVALLAPFVSSEQSNATLTTILSRLPNSIVNQWSNLASFINTKLMPISTTSSSIVSDLSASLFPSRPSSSSPLDPTSNPVLTAAQERYHLPDDAPLAAALEKLQSQYFFAEDTSGLNEEARLCLRKGGEGSWGVCEDYAAMVDEIVAGEKARRGSGEGERQGTKLRVELWFAESDVLIGKGGQRVMEELWGTDAVCEVVDVRMKVAAGTDHDSVLVDRQKGGMRSIFATIGGKRESSIDE